MTASLPLIVSLLLMQAPPQTPPKPTVPAPVQGPYEFTTDLGAFLIVVKSDKAAQFDGAMARLKQVISASSNKDRKAQAVGWRVLKSSEDATDGAITYLWLVEPAAKTASYDPIAIMKELSPADVQPVYDQLQASVVSITRIGLKELLKMGGS